jgi:hypothetical protein
MKKIHQFSFRKWSIVKLSGAYYVNFFVEKSVFIVIDGVRHYKVKKAVLRRLGVRFAPRPVPRPAEQMLPLAA